MHVGLVYFQNMINRFVDYCHKASIIVSGTVLVAAIVTIMVAVAPVLLVLVVVMVMM